MLFTEALAAPVSSSDFFLKAPTAIFCSPALDEPKERSAGEVGEWKRMSRRVREKIRERGSSEGGLT